jgi:hypothetical protein
VKAGDLVKIDGGSLAWTTEFAGVPDIGHLVRARNRTRSVALPDTATPALVVDKRGIEIQVLLPSGRFSWIRRAQVEVITMVQPV